MAKNSWFKHYNDAHEGNTIAQLWYENDTETIAFYWTLLEIVSRWEDEENRGKLVINSATFKSKLGINFQRSSKLLQKIAKTFKIEVNQISDKSWEVFVPNWLELQENRGGKKRAKKEQSLTKKPTEERSKNKDTDIEIGGGHILFELWNKHRGSLPAAISLTKQRTVSANRRWKDHPDEEFWIEIISKIKSSPFHCGQNDRKWVATFDYFLKPDTAVKILEQSRALKVVKNSTMGVIGN